MVVILFSGITCGNYYFFKEGRGMYGNVSYGILDAKLTINDIESETDPNKTGSARTAISNNSINIKIISLETYSILDKYE